MIGRRALLTGLVLSGLATAARAQNADPATPVVALNAALLDAMKAGPSTPFAQRAAMISPAIQNTFDLQTILRVVVGAPLAAFSPADQAALLAAFTRYTVDSYTANFDRFGGETFAILPNPRAVGSDRVVATTLTPSNGSPTRLDYVMRQSGSGWHVVDILLDASISRVAVQRSDYRALVGNGAPALIAKLNEKSASLEAGAKG